jgi:hypothetical protein
MTTTPKPQTWRRYSGDNDSITVKLNGIDTLLGGAVVTATLTDTDTGTSQSVSGSVVSTVDKTVMIPLTTWLTTRAPNRYDVRIHIDNRTWPEAGLMWIDVIAKLATTP